MMKVARLPLLLRLDLVDGTAGIAPGRKAAAHMRDRLQSHILRGLGRERRAQSAGAMKDEFLFLLEDRLGIGAGRIDPEFQHPARAGERAGNSPVTLDFAGIADIDDDDVIALRSLDRLDCAQRFDFGIGLVDQRLDAAVYGLGHFMLPRLCKPPPLTSPGRMQRSSRCTAEGGRNGFRSCNGPASGAPTRCAASWARIPVTAPVPSSQRPDPRS